MLHYLSTELVIPIWCPQNSLFVMGGSYQENMVHWTDRRLDMLMVTTDEGLGQVEQHLRNMHSHKVAQTYLDNTFRSIVNHSGQRPMSGITY